MRSPETSKHLEDARLRVARRVRALRLERGWTQAELARHLGLSQARLSEIERGGGSFTAEQLLVVLGLFNVGIGAFLPPVNPDDELQNALLQLGATHLRQVPGLATTGRYDSPADVILATLLEARSPRLVTALAPVLVKHVDAISLPAVRLVMRREGRANRLGWLLENIRDALRIALPEAEGPLRRSAARALAVLDNELAHFDVELERSSPDLFDPTIRSRQTQQQVWEHAASDLSRRWGVVSELQPDDFLEALRSADGPR